MESVLSGFQINPFVNPTMKNKKPMKSGYELAINILKKKDKNGIVEISVKEFCEELGIDSNILVAQLDDMRADELISLAHASSSPAITISFKVIFNDYDKKVKIKVTKDGETLLKNHLKDQ